MGTNMLGQQDRCPQCGGKLKLVHPLGNALKTLRFISCTDPRCDYVLVEEVLPPPSIGLPVDYDEVLTVIENERREAEKNIVKLGRGVLLGRRLSEDGTMIVANIKVTRRGEDFRLRPFDSIYYGRALGVVLRQDPDGGLLTLLFKSSDNVELEADIIQAEPVMLYQSAGDILRRRAERNRGLSCFVGVPGISPPSRGPFMAFRASTPSSRTTTYDLDPEKKAIVEEILSMPDWSYVSVEGPPGTGKTMVIAAAAVQAVEAGKRILITSHTNVAVDNALERILKIRPDLRGLLARIGHPAKVSKSIKDLITEPEPGEGHRRWLQRILEEKRVIGMTITKLAVCDSVYRLDEVSVERGAWPTFDYVFIDESSMVPLCMAIVPIYYGRRWVIVGDSRQLPPILKTQHLYAGAHSLMELASTQPGRVRMLTIQRRGNKRIFEAISHIFYLDALRHHGEASDSLLSLRIEAGIDGWLGEVLNPNEPLTWIQVRDGKMEWQRIRRGRYEGASGVNVAEAAAVLKLYEAFINSGVDPSSIAIISTYRAQSDLIREAISRGAGLKRRAQAGLRTSFASLYLWSVNEDISEPDEPESILDLRVAETVDSYQGREKELVIYSMTADYEHKALQDYRRVNVAFTRARSKLIIVSSLKSFEGTPWLKYLKHRSYKVEIGERDLNPELKYVEDVYSRLFRRRSDIIDRNT